MEAIVIADEMSDSDHGIYTATAAAATSNVPTATITAAAAVVAVRASVSPTLVDECSPHQVALELEASMNLIALSGHGVYGSGGAYCHRILPTVSLGFSSNPRPSKVVRFAPSPHHNEQGQQQQQHLKKRRLDRDYEPTPTATTPTEQWITAGERTTASFPLPRLARAARNSPMIRTLPQLASFRATWNRVNRICDAMDDTPADREALVKELFLRSLSRHDDPLERARIVPATDGVACGSVAQSGIQQCNPPPAIQE
jgi:hypothetical protein